MSLLRQILRGIVMALCLFGMGFLAVLWFRSAVLVDGDELSYMSTAGELDFTGFRLDLGTDEDRVRFWWTYNTPLTTPSPYQAKGPVTGEWCWSVVPRGLRYRDSTGHRALPPGTSLLSGTQTLRIWHLFDGTWRDVNEVYRTPGTPGPGVGLTLLLLDRSELPWPLTVHKVSCSAKVPAWMLMALLGIYPAVRLGHLIRRRRRIGRGLCATCGYDLRASPERCPECGTMRDVPQITSPPQAEAGAGHRDGQCGPTREVIP